MNQEQRTYCINRINSMLAETEKSLKAEYCTEEVRLSEKQKLDLIYAGKVKLLPRTTVKSWTDLVDAFDFSSHESDVIFDERGFKKRFKPLSDKAAFLRDQVMLGDAKDFADLLAAFEKELSEQP